MENEQLCPSCEETIENGALYCGNCGQKLTKGRSFLDNAYQNNQKTAPSPEVDTSVPAPVALDTVIPSYAIPYGHHKQHYAALALAFGTLGVAASFILPVLGIVFAVIGLVLISLCFKITHGRLRLVAVVVPILALLIGLGFWVKAYNDSKLVAPAGTANGTAMLEVTTPCFSLTFQEILNVNNSSGSCSLNAYNSNTFANSSDVYKIVAEKATIITASNFVSITKPDIANDISKNLPNFIITSNGSTLFAGSQAYYEEAYDSSLDISIIEEAVYHPTTANIDNFFDIVHVLGGKSVNINEIKQSWQWGS